MTLLREENSVGVPFTRMCVYVLLTIFDPGEGEASSPSDIFFNQ
jgi:hypothetical protein